MEGFLASRISLGSKRSRNEMSANRIKQISGWHLLSRIGTITAAENKTLLDVFRKADFFLTVNTGLEVF